MSDHWGQTCCWEMMMMKKKKRKTVMKPLHLRFTSPSIIYNGASHRDSDCDRAAKDRRALIHALCFLNEESWLTWALHGQTAKPICVCVCVCLSICIQYRFILSYEDSSFSRQLCTFVNKGTFMFDKWILWKKKRTAVRLVLFCS